MTWIVGDRWWAVECVRAGRTRDWIAAKLNLSSQQVQAAIDQDYDFRQFASVKLRIQAKCGVLPVTSTRPCSMAVAAMMMSASDLG